MGHFYKPEHQIRDIRSMLKIVLPEAISVFHIDMVCKTICKIDINKKERKSKISFVSASNFHKEYLLNSTPYNKILHFQLEK